jgi:DNA modification methylase
VKTERVTVASLLFDPANVRKHGERNLDSIKSSLARFGQQKPIVVDADGIVRAGNGTLMAAKALGWDEIEIVRTNLRGSEATAYAIADNRTAELAEWDEVALAEQLAALQIDDETLAAATGFDASEIERMALPVDVVEDEVPEVPVEPITKPGDLWLLGEHRVLCGDCSRNGNLDRLLNGAGIDAILTDPPYCSGGMVRGDRTQKTSAKYVQGDSIATSRIEFTGDSRDQRSFLQWATIWIGDAHAKCEDGALCMVFTDWRQLPLMSDAIQGGGFVWRNIVTWWKPGCRMQRGRFSLSAEYLLYASRGVPHDGEQSPQNVLQCRGVDGEDKEHIAQKPVELLAQVMGVTRRGSVVYDPFLGSGTTLIAAEQLGRKCYGMEISPSYCDVIVKRWETLTGKKATLAA